jgi:hypothetical protein
MPVPKRILFLLALGKITFLTVSLSWNAFAQKAEPVRIEFHRGSTSATVQGELQGRQQMSYAVAARARQRVSLRLVSSEPRALQLKLYDPGGTELPLHKSGKIWKTIAPQAGDYEIWVLRSAGGTGSSRYQLIVSIQ